MPLLERLLLRLSRDPKAEDYSDSKNSWTIQNALVPLFKNFPRLAAELTGKKVLDFGCGEGWQTLALARHQPELVVGLDSNATTLAKARKNAEEQGNLPNLEFEQSLDAKALGSFDIVISQNSMEHFPNPLKALEQMRDCLSAGGRIYLAFGPPWYAPYGSHMFFFTRVPWVNLLFPEKTVMSVRKHFRNDGAERYEDVESGLNRMSLRRFEKLIANSGLVIESTQYRAVKKLNFLSRVPVVRELFVNYVCCVLRRESSDVKSF